MIKARFRVRLVAALALACPQAAAAQQIRITGLSDVNFGSISNTATDLVNSQTVCVTTTNLLNSSYQVYATGSGTGSALTLSSGGSAMPFEVQWSAQGGQTSGTNLASNVQRTFFPPLFFNSCTIFGGALSSLITIIRASTINSAGGGSYSGTLTLIFAPG